MSGPNWLPPRNLGSPDRATTPMSHSGPALYRPPKKGLPDQRPKYNMYDQNGGTGGNVMPIRYMATGPSGKSPVTIAFKRFNACLYIMLAS